MQFSSAKKTQFTNAILFDNISREKFCLKYHPFNKKCAQRARRSVSFFDGEKYADENL